MWDNNEASQTEDSKTTKKQSWNIGAKNKILTKNLRQKSKGLIF